MYSRRKAGSGWTSMRRLNGWDIEDDCKVKWNENAEEIIEEEEIEECNFNDDAQGLKIASLDFEMRALMLDLDSEELIDDSY